MKSFDNEQYQYGFSTTHSAKMYDETGRAVKAKKAMSVLKSELGPLVDKRLLDIGCSTGLMTRLYAQEFAEVIGIDIDESAVQYAIEQNQRSNVAFEVRDSMDTGFPDSFFDIVTCTHIYEHVPDAQRLLDEIYRVLKPGGGCMFAAGNRYTLMEPHYRLPLLSAVPKWLGHRYIRVSKKADFYYETHLSYRGLRKLTSQFEVSDYTIRAIRNPEHFLATDMVREGSLKQSIALTVLRSAYWLAPTYLWVLRKPMSA